ncbi:MAG: serine hydrolase domain-containing protein [Planctomycetota bacterium]|jgi:CubicO group peptidase (beta-lactamase class C family)
MVRFSKLFASAILAVAGTSITGLADESRMVFPGRDWEETTQQSQDIDAGGYFPPPESKGGWRKLDDADDIRRLGGMDVGKLSGLKEWLFRSDKRNFAAVVIRHGHVVLEVERGNSAKTDSRRVASVSKAVCATVLAIASEQSQQGKTPKTMTFDDRAFDFIPEARPLSDPRKARITVKQLLNHTSGITPEATGARNQGPWKHVLGHDNNPHTEKLAFDPGTNCGYSTFALYHASLVCENVTGKAYDQFAIASLFRPIGCEHWWFQHFEGGGNKYGRHPSHAMGMPARDLARIAYCMLRDGRWNDKQVIPRWFVDETAQPTHSVKGPEMRFRINAETFSHGWELPACLTGEGGTPSGHGIPADARYKPGSGGQLIAFVPSLDLVVTRQTGSSGPWEYAEYLRRACAAVLPGAKEEQSRAEPFKVFSETGRSANVKQGVEAPRTQRQPPVRGLGRAERLQRGLDGHSQGPAAGRARRGCAGGLEVRSLVGRAGGWREGPKHPHRGRPGHEADGALPAAGRRREMTWHLPRIPPGRRGLPDRPADPTFGVSQKARAHSQE